MRRVLRILGRLLGAIVLLLGALWLLGPYEPAKLQVRFDPAALGADLDAYFADAEAAYDDITPGTEKRVIWYGDRGVETEWSLLYVHGFSATSEEIRPVPDRVASALGANLVYTRLRGHGRRGDAMAEADVAAWMRDVAEGLAAARAVGRRVLVISTSTGGTLVTAAAHDAGLSRDVAGLVFVAPNYGVNNPLAPLLTWPAARWWLPKLAGERRSFEPLNDRQARYWTTEYPSVAALPMGALIKAVNGLDHGKVQIPALFWYSQADRVVRPDRIEAVVSAWGGPVRVVQPELNAQTDPYAHVLAGDVMSPGQTDTAVAGILDWVEGL